MPVRSTPTAATGLSVSPRTMPSSRSSVCRLSSPFEVGVAARDHDAVERAQRAGAGREQRPGHAAQQRPALHELDAHAPAERLQQLRPLLELRVARPRRGARPARSSVRRPADGERARPAGAPDPASASRTSSAIASDGLPRKTRPMRWPVQPAGDEQRVGGLRVAALGVERLLRRAPLLAGAVDVGAQRLAHRLLGATRRAPRRRSPRRAARPTTSATRTATSETAW